MNEGGYLSKSLYMSNVDGNKIVEEQQRINLSENMKVIATTILMGGIDEEQGRAQLFHAWIYYKVKAGVIDIKI